jgi:triose/dihydroxyacetone kinase / FAD-AMP lyase (cyclizing)
MGGTSGAIYAIFLNAVVTSLAKKTVDVISPASVKVLIAEALGEGLGELFKYTLARKGHRTLMDALIPFVETFQEKGDFREAYEEACRGAKSTAKMTAVLGRASYVGKERFAGEDGIPDPGALGIVSILKGINKGLYGGS